MLYSQYDTYEKMNNSIDRDYWGEKSCKNSRKENELIVLSYIASLLIKKFNNIGIDLKTYLATTRYLSSSFYLSGIVQTEIIKYDTAHVEDYFVKGYPFGEYKLFEQFNAPEDEIIYFYIDNLSIIIHTTKFNHIVEHSLIKSYLINEEDINKLTDFYVDYYKKYKFMNRRID